MSVGSDLFIVVHGGSGRGGAEKTTLAWCRIAQGLGYRVRLLTSNDAFDCAEDIVKRKCLEADLAGEVTGILREYAENKIKMYFVFVHAHIAVRCRQALKHCVSTNATAIVSMRNDLFEVVVERNFKLLLCLIYLFIFKNRISCFTFNSLEATLLGKKIFGTKARYVPNLIERGLTKKRSKKSHVTEFLYLGRFEKQKNIRNLLAASYLLSRRGCEFKLTLVGEGSLYSEIEDFIVENKLGDVINLEPYSPDICSYLRKADALLLTSYYEGFPNVLLEALSQNTFLICTPFRSGARELIESEKIGYLANGFGGTHIADAMNKYIKQAPVQDISMVKKILARYDNKSLSVSLKGLLESCDENAF